MSPAGVDLDELRRLEHAARPLEPGAARRRQLRGTVMAAAERFLRRVHDLKGFNAVTDPGAGLRQAPIGERGRPMADVVRLFEQEVVWPGANTAAGAHLAYIPGGGLYHAALGDYLAAVTNKYAGLFFTGPGLVRMENMLLRWMCELVGYPAGAGGNIASGGSIATLTAVTTARDAHQLRGAETARACVYLTAHAHHCITKSLHLAGVGDAQLRTIAVDQRLRMRVDALEQAIAADRAAGLRPWLVVASAGTTDTGAVDPLDPIGRLAARAGCWFHVDAAYGGFFLLTEHGRTMLRGIERSDSVVLDPHKGLFLPYGCGVVLARDVRRLLATHRASGHYLQDAPEDPAEVSPADVSPELTKHFRALRMWLPLVHLGLGPFRAALEEKLLLARYFRERVAALGFDTGPEPDLSIVTYRWAPPHLSLEQANAANLGIIEHTRRDGRVFLSSTMIDGRYTLRLAAVSFRTHRRTIDLALDVLREARPAGSGAG